jgi:hypothetical protein
MSTTAVVLALLGSLHQLRQLIKDLTFRNAQERERGELELNERRARIGGAGELPPAHYRPEGRASLVPLIGQVPCRKKPRLGRLWLRQVASL